MAIATRGVAAATSECDSIQRGGGIRRSLYIYISLRYEANAF